MGQPQPKPRSKKEKSLLVRVLLRIAYGILGGALVLLSIWIFFHRNDARFINYCVACIPVALTIVIAWIPDLRRAHMAWRIAIVTVGLIWSVLLWRQLDITAKQTEQDQKKIVNDAVERSNKHSDQKFDPLQAQVTDLGKNLDITEKTITTALEKTKTDLDSSIGKVGKPEPPELAKLRVSLWKEGQDQTSEPVESETVQRNADGSVTVQFVIRDISSTGADDIDLWVLICADCTYSKEPEGFEKVIGNKEQERHIHIPGTLNPGVAFKVLSVTFKSDLKFTQYPIGFSYSCKNCGKIEPTKRFIMNVEPSLMPLQ